MFRFDQIEDDFPKLLSVSKLWDINGDLSAFQYKPLGKEEFRLITIERGEFSDPITIRIVHTPLQPVAAGYTTATPFFEALSYTWGDGRGRQPVRCMPRGYLLVTQNLENALRRLRYRDRERTIWADAISINQDDIYEKNHQVQQMVTIYETANRVLVYLGEEGDGSDTAMSCLSDIRGQISDTDSNAVQRLFHRSWFSRIWVIQEVARSQAAVVICGSRAVPWDCFNIWPIRQTSTVQPPSILNYRSGFTPTKGSLLKLLHETRSSLATDHRDKVIGLLGLIPNEEQWISLIDYAAPVEDIYTQVAMTIIEDSLSLQILSAVQRSHRRLPSWVPDWSEKPAVNALGLGNDYVEPYNAGGHPAKFIFVPYSRHLRAKGVFVGKILRVIGIGEDWGSYQDNFTVGSRLTPNGEFAGFLTTKSGRQTLLTWMEMAGVFRSSQKLYPQRPLQFLEPTWERTPELDRFSKVLCAEPPSALETSGQNELARIGGRWLEWWRFNNGGTSQPFMSEAMKRFERRIFHVHYGRSLFVTDNGFMGLGPTDAVPGDEVVVLLGGSTPFVLRSENGFQNFKLVGECYVEGIMDCEALHHVREELEADGCRLSPTSHARCSSPLKQFCLI